MLFLSLTPTELAVYLYIVYHIQYVFIDEIFEISHYHFLFYKYRWSVIDMYASKFNVDKYSDKKLLIEENTKKRTKQTQLEHIFFFTISNVFLNVRIPWVFDIVYSV